MPDAIETKKIMSNYKKHSRMSFPDLRKAGKDILVFDENEEELEGTETAMTDTN